MFYCEYKRLDNLLSGAKDTSDFLEWQSTMRQKDQDEKMAESEQRRVMGKLSHEEAILARQNQVQANKEMVPYSFLFYEIWRVCVAYLFTFSNMLDVQYLSLPAIMLVSTKFFTQYTQLLMHFSGVTTEVWNG